MEHEARMALAKRVTEFLRNRHKDLLAVAVHGSTAKGEDREWSDLEMFAVTRGPSPTEYYQAIHDGIVVEVAFVSEVDARKGAGKIPWDWPVSADGWIHTVATHDPGDLLPQLAALASNPSEEKIVRGMRNSYVAMYEDLCKMRNWAAEGSDAMVRFMCHGLATYGAARFLAFLNRAYYNGARNLLTKPREFAHLPAGFWEDYPRLLAVDGATADLQRRAERLFAGCRRMYLESGHAIPEGPPLEDALEAGRVVR